MKKSVLLLIILFFVDIAASAQLVKSRIGGNSQHQLTFSAGVNYPSFDINRNIGPTIGLSYTYFFIPQLGARVIGNYHYFDGTTNAIPYYSHNAELEIEGVYNFFNNQSRIKQPSNARLWKCTIVFSLLSLSISHCRHFTPAITVGCLQSLILHLLIFLKLYYLV